VFVRLEIVFALAAQLIDGGYGNTYGPEKYDGELHDIFDLQDQITQKVVSALLTQIKCTLAKK